MSESPRPTVLELCTGTLYRANACVGEAFSGPLGASAERVVFFEAPRLTEPGVHLQQLLGLAWCVDTTAWLERGRIYGLESAESLMASSYAAVDTGELRLFEIGAGGDPDEVIGPDELRYARATDVDLFVTPPVAVRLQALLGTIEAMYIAGPVVRAAFSLR